MLVLWPADAVYPHRSQVDCAPDQAGPQDWCASSQRDDGKPRHSSCGARAGTPLTHVYCCLVQALHPAAYHAYSTTSDLNKIVAHYASRVHEGVGAGALRRQSSMEASLMTPVKPMLARACKSFQVSSPCFMPRGLSKTPRSLTTLCVVSPRRMRCAGSDATVPQRHVRGNQVRR